jgi:hypothetical protein
VPPMHVLQRIILVLMVVMAVIQVGMLVAR